MYKSFFEFEEKNKLFERKIEPHPITREDYENISNPFLKEIINTGIKVA